MSSEQKKVNLSAIATNISHCVTGVTVKICHLLIIFDWSVWFNLSNVDAIDKSNIFAN